MEGLVGKEKRSRKREKVDSLGGFAASRVVVRFIRQDGQSLEVVSSRKLFGGVQRRGGLDTAGA